MRSHCLQPTLTDSPRTVSGCTVSTNVTSWILTVGSGVEPLHARARPFEFNRVLSRRSALPAKTYSVFECLAPIARIPQRPAPPSSETETRRAASGSPEGGRPLLFCTPAALVDTAPSRAFSPAAPPTFFRRFHEPGKALLRMSSLRSREAPRTPPRESFANTRTRERTTWGIGKNAPPPTTARLPGGARTGQAPRRASALRRARARARTSYYYY